MDEVTTPESKKISPSKLMGTDTPALGKVGQGSQRGKPTVGNLARIVRHSRVKINENEKKIKVNVDKLMGHDDEIEQVHETLFDVVEKQGELQAQQKKGDGTTEGMEALSANLDTIAKELTSINTLLGTQLKNQEKAAQQAAAAARAEKRRKDEEKAEKKPSKSDTPKFKAPKPVVDFFDKIKNFFTQVLLGSAVLGIVKWMKDPENKKKINDVVDFIADNTPIILGGLLAIIGVGIGAKLIAFTSGLIGLTTTLIGLLGPFGLGAVLAALAAVGTAFLLDKYVKPMMQNQVGGVGFTQTGLAFGYEDVVDLRDDFNNFANDKGWPDEWKRPRLNMFDDLMASMRENKKINDDLFRAKEQLEMYQSKVGTPEGMKQGAQGQVNRLNKLIAKLENDKRYSNKMVTQNWMRLQITDEQLSETIRSNDRMAVRTPGAVDPSLRREPGPRPASPGTESSVGAMAQRAMVGSGIKKSKEGFNTDSKASQLASSFMNGMKMEMPNYSSVNLTAASWSSQGIMGDYLDEAEKDIKVPDLNHQVKLDTKNIFSGKTTIDIPPPGSDGGVTILGLDGKPAESGSGAVVTGNQSNFTPFSSYDPNNDSFASVMSIYNAL